MATRGQKLSGGNVIAGQGTGGGSQTGSNWTNLSQYLDNNKGAGEGMADDITKGAQGEIDRLDKQGGAVDTWDTEAKKQVDQGTRQDTYSNTIQNGAAKEVAGIDQKAYGAWSALGNYTGAKDATNAQGYDQVYKDVNNAKDQVKNLNSYEGQKAALAKTYKGAGGYGNGFQALDAFALNGDASGQAKLQGFQQQNANFGQKFDKAVSGVNDYIGGAGARGEAVLNKTNQAITGRQGSINSAGASARDADADSIYAEDLRVANAKAPTDNSLTGMAGSQYVTQNRGDANAYLGQDDLDALINLNAIDGSAATGQITPGAKASSGLNWEALAKYAPIMGPGSMIPGSLAPGTPTSDNLQMQDEVNPTRVAGGKAGGTTVTRKSSQR